MILLNKFILNSYANSWQVEIANGLSWWYSGYEMNRLHFKCYDIKFKLDSFLIKTKRYFKTPNLIASDKFACYRNNDKTINSLHINTKIAERISLQYLMKIVDFSDKGIGDFIIEKNKISASHSNLNFSNLI